MLTAESRNDRVPAPRADIGEATLSPYFQEIAVHSLLSPAQEVALARELIRREEQIWARMLSRISLIGPVADLAQQRLGKLPASVEMLRHQSATARRGSPRGAWRGHRARCAQAARSMRALDTDREVLNGSLVLVARLAAGLERLPRGVTRRGLSIFYADLQQRNAAALRVRNRFVEANLRLVLAMVRRFHNDWLPLEDLVQEGNLGLLRAVGRFQPDRGFRFSTYATWWIRHSIMRALADKGALVRVPVHAHDLSRRLMAVTGYLASQLGREPTIEELASQLGFCATRLRKLTHDSHQAYCSTDAELSENDPRRLSDVLTDPDARNQEDQAMAAELCRQVSAVLDRLPKLEAEILRRRYGLEGEAPCTLRELGEEHSLSRERIRQLQTRALGRVRMALKFVDPTDRPASTV